MSGKVTILSDVDGAEGFFRRARAHARSLDAGERLPDEVVIAFENPAEMMKMLTGERLRLLQSLREAGETRIAELAERLGRDKRAVSRDVNAMRVHGLVLTKYVANAGHGRNLVVMPSAKRMELKAAI
ncbi:MAG: MarR family transcriptional regulator [Acidobacteria bacterium]|nr:MarR family transcriptional regulator [Acidobacteriota bacterium]